MKFGIFTTHTKLTGGEVTSTALDGSAFSDDMKLCGSNTFKKTVQQRQQLRLRQRRKKRQLMYRASTYIGTTGMVG
ncbi:MAG: hypothetical protein MJ115_00775 [Clostridia bacterium]|nr:hypothetical protein [Clostridia bacterium]